MAEEEKERTDEGRDVEGAVEPETYQRKITTTATIKDCRIKAECAELHFDGLFFSPQQYGQIAGWIAAKEGLLVSIEPAQKECLSERVDLPPGPFASPV